jgi:hypothetical protein
MILSLEIIKKLILILVVLSFVLIPIFSDAALIPCTNEPGNEEERCDYGKFIELIQNFLDWAILISGSLAAISFAYAGFLYLTGGANPGTRQKAKDIFTKVLIGFVVVLSAWLIVHAIISGLGLDPEISPLESPLES